jgi:hypothetical protein
MNRKAREAVAEDAPRAVAKERKEMIEDRK